MPTLIGGAFLTAFTATGAFGFWANSRNRRKEVRHFEDDAPALSAQESRWDLKHVREDLGRLVVAAAIMNGLLAAILATMLVR